MSNVKCQKHANVKCQKKMSKRNTELGSRRVHVICLVSAEICISPTRLAYKGFLLDTQATGGLCGPIRAPGSLGNVPPLVPWASRAWFLSPKVKSQKCPTFQKCEKQPLFCLFALRAQSNVKDVKCKMSKNSQNICQLSNIKCQKCQMSNNVNTSKKQIKCQLSSVKHVKCQIPNAKCQQSKMPNAKCQKYQNCQHVNCQM